MPKREKAAARAAEPRIPNGGNGGPPCDPDDFAVAAIQGPTTIGINQTVQLHGTAQEEIITAQCHLTKKATQFSWQLFLKPTGGAEVDVSASLVAGNSLNPSFVASKFGTYRAVITAGNNQIGFDTAEVSVVVFQPTLLLESQGKLTFLRVNEVGDSFGPAGDAIRVEAIAQLDSEPGKSFGFELRNDKQRPAHQGMLDLLRDAFANDSTVLLDYLIPQGNNNGILIRVALTK